jgi:hypothetical protein
MYGLLGYIENAGLVVVLLKELGLFDRPLARRRGW